MTLQFAGVGSGLPISDWIDVLVKIKQEKIDELSTKQKALQTKSDKLNALKSTYASVQSSTVKLTDSLHGSASDIFSSVEATVSDDTMIKATVTQVATPSKMSIEVLQLATQTEQTTNSSDVFRNSSKKLSELSPDLKEGVIKINDATINVSPDMTVDSLIYSINNSPNAKVKAYLENGKMVLQSTESGEKDIQIQDISSNFGEISGLLVKDPTTGDKSINTDNQTLGQNAQYKMDGGDVKTATSNTLTSADTGIAGLTLELLSETTEDDPITLEIAREYKPDKVLTELQTFVTNFNTAIKDTDTETNAQANGTLTGENNLTSIRNRLRTAVSDQILPNGEFKSLADIGISTGAAGLDVDADTTQLVIDKEKFYDAYTKNPAAVKALLVGETATTSSTGKATTGVMQNLQNVLDTALSTDGVYFKARSESLSSQISNMADTITKKQEQLLRYQTQITNQFTLMDQQIATMNSQFDQMSQQLASIGINMSSS